MDIPVSCRWIVLVITIQKSSKNVPLVFDLSDILHAAQILFAQFHVASATACRGIHGMILMNRPIPRGRYHIKYQE